MTSSNHIPLALSVLAFCVAPVAAQQEEPAKAVPAIPLIQPGQAKQQEPVPAGQPREGRAGVRAMPLMQPAGAASTGALSASEDVAAYSALEAEFARAYGDWMKTVNELRGTGKEYPPQPQGDFYPRFRELADSGDVDARLWCLSNFAQYDTTPAEFRAAAWKGEAYSLATALRNNEKGSSKLIRSLGGGANIDGVGQKGIDKIFAYMTGTTDLVAIKASILASRASSADRSNNPEMKAKAAGLYEELLAKYPDSPQAGRAKGKLFAANNLQVGQTPPNFSGKSVDGETINLTDYRGKVLVLDFWGFW